MRKSFLAAGLALVFLVGSAPRASAQDGFVVGFRDIGPVIGLGGIGGADYSIGGRFEQGYRSLPNLNNGVLGIGVGVNYWTYDEEFLFADYGFDYLAIDVTGNYHFNLINKKWDPFVGAGLGFRRVSSDLDDEFFGDFDVSDSGVYFIGHAGIRYFWRPKLALYADVGAGSSSLSVGVMFRLK